MATIADYYATVDQHKDQLKDPNLATARACRANRVVNPTVAVGISHSKKDLLPVR